VGAREAALKVGADPRSGPTEVYLVGSPRRFPLEAAACRFGGFRWWWVCPDCGRRRASLYRAGRRFGCRACLDLAYRSQQESRGDDRLFRKLAALAGGLRPEDVRRALAPLGRPRRRPGN
jgi:hypothetical protein